MKNILNTIAYIMGRKVRRDSLHPEYKSKIQHVKTVKDDEGNDVPLYMFESIEDMPARRYSSLNEFLEDRKRGMSKEELQLNLDEIISYFDENSVSGVTNALSVIKWMRTRCKIAYDADIVMRIISCAVFTRDEDLTKYDWDIGTWKIELMEKNGLENFFLSAPIMKYWSLTPISKKDMEIILEQRKLKVQLYKELKEMGISVSNTYPKRKK